jgi:hypothetical protein
MHIRCLPDFCWLFAFVFSLGCVYVCFHLPCTFDGWVPILDFYVHDFSSIYGFSLCIWLFLHKGADCFVFIGLIGGFLDKSDHECVASYKLPIPWDKNGQTTLPHPFMVVRSAYKASKRNEWRLCLMDEETSSCVAWPSFK